MASSSTASRNWRYHVFPSFRGEDVRSSFLSHLLMELDRKLITTFIDNGIDRSRPIGPELSLAIKESRIAIVIFSKNYASSSWCLNELVEIHRCFKDLDQMVIPIFYHVDPSEVRKQTGEFGERFNETCKDKTEDERERWIRALTDVAEFAGEDSKNWIVEGEAKMIEHIAKDVFKKLMIPPNDFSEIVGIEAHLEGLKLILRVESDEEVRKVGIWGTSGVGKSTIGRALSSLLSIQFHHHAFVSYERKHKWDDSKMKLSLDKRLLSKLLCQKVKISNFGVAKQRLMHKKVLIIVDDVDDLDVLNTLMDQTSLVGSGSRIVVITQDKRLLKSQEIELIYEVELPSYDLAMQMFCRSAFRKNSPPDGFEELARKVTLHSSNLPLGLSTLGSSLKGMTKEEWVETLPTLLNSLGRKIKNTLKVCYDRLEGKEQELFLYIACLSDGHNVNFLQNLLGESAEIGLKILNDKSLIRRESTDFVGMHSLLQKLGKEINIADPINNRRFLTEAEDICDVLTDKTGTENTLAMDLNTSEINGPLFIDEKSFQGMRNMKLLNFYNSPRPWETGKGRLYLPDRGLDHFPRKLRLLHWDEYPSKCMPFHFRAECLVELKMERSKLEKLWEGTQILESLKEMNMSYSVDLKEIPDLSKAINIKELNLRGCSSLVALHSSIGNLSKLHGLKLAGCTSLVALPSSFGDLNELYELDLVGCKSLVTLPSSIGNLSKLYRLRLLGCKSLVALPSSIGNLSKLYELNLVGCTSLVELPSSFGNLSELYDLDLRGCSSLVTLPSSIGNLSKLYELDLEYCSSLVTLPSSIGNLKLLRLKLWGCRSLVTLPSSIRNLSKLSKLDLSECSNLKFLPADVDLESLEVLNLNGCSQLRMFPHISKSIKELYLEETALEGEEDSSWIENIPHLRRLCWNDVPLSCMPSNFSPEDLEYLVMSSGKLKKLWGGVKSLEYVLEMHLTGCESLVEIPDLSMAINLGYLELGNCKSLVMLPSSIRNLHYLKSLNMEGCTMLEVLPVDIDLFNLEELNLSGCSKLRNFPQISTRIEQLYLDDTAIEEIPSWIKNMSSLWKLKMRRSKNLKNISIDIFKLEDLTADFSDCGGITTICDHLPGPPNDFFDISSYSSYRYPRVTPFKFYNCFNLDRDAQEIIIQSYPNMAVIPGGEVPTYFIHRASGSSLSILLPESSLSQESILLKTCIVVGPSSHRTKEYFKVLQSFRGQKEEIPCDAEVDACTYKMDHLVLFILHLQIKRMDNWPSELNNNVLLLEFYNIHYDPYAYNFPHSSFGSHEPKSTVVEIKGCGVRVMDILETDFEESDFLSDLFVRSDEGNYQESDEESTRSRKTI